VIIELKGKYKGKVLPEDATDAKEEKKSCGRRD
jgi:hypothetical protein